MPYVLGYTEKGDFDPQTLPPAMLDWLEGYSRMIEAAQAQGLGPRVQTRANDKENIAPLVSAHWSQGAPYNNLCPYMSNGSGRALTGCVATAAAQVAYYWRKELPDRSQYDTPTYGYGDAPVTESFPKGTPLQWELMQDNYGGSTPEDMNTAVATLMAITGTSTWLTYGSSTSGQIRDLVNTFSGTIPHGQPMHVQIRYQPVGMGRHGVRRLGKRLAHRVQRSIPDIRRTCRSGRRIPRLGQPFPF